MYLRSKYAQATGLLETRDAVQVLFRKNKATQVYIHIDELRNNIWIIFKQKKMPLLVLHVWNHPFLANPNLHTIRYDWQTFPVGNCVPNFCFHLGMCMYKLDIHWYLHDQWKKNSACYFLGLHKLHGKIGHVHKHCFGWCERIFLSSPPHIWGAD